MHASNGRCEEVCKDCRTWEEEIYWNRFQTLHFCQILPRDFRHNLIIPKKFAENMWTKLPPRVSLIGPSGSTWDVDLIASGDVMCFLDGWEDFAKACCLEENDILIFKYNGSSCFNVLVFNGNNFCEREAMYFIRRCGHAKPNGGSEKKRDMRQGNLEEEDSEPFPTKKTRKDADGKPLEHTVGSQGPPSKRPEKDRGGRPMEDDNGCDWSPLMEHGEDAAEKGHSCIRRNPKRSLPLKSNGRSSSRIATNSSDILRAEDVPSSEAEESSQLTPTSAEESTEEYNGSPVKQTLDRRVKTRGRPKMVVRRKSVLPKGVPSSSTGKLKCPSAGPSSLGVKGDSYISKRRLVTDIEKEDAFQLAKKELTYEGFIKVMRPTYIQKHFFMTMPTEWTEKHMSHVNQEVTLRMGEITWSVRLVFTSKGIAALSTGWKKFVLDNGLEEFDVCLFKLASQKDEAIVLDVKIFRAVAEDAPSTPVIAF